MLPKRNAHIINSSGGMMPKKISDAVYMLSIRKILSNNGPNQASKSMAT